jgi:Berberine and berberine like
VARPRRERLHTTWARSAWDAFSPHLHDAVSYINHLNGDERPEQVRASYGSNLQRLRTIKHTFDPFNAFRMNPNIT